MHPISLYVVLIGAPLLTLPLAAQMSQSHSPSYLKMKVCVSTMAKADQLIADIADSYRTNAAEKQLEIARNMMDQRDDQGCVTYIDNAVRAIK